jgi:transposase
MSKKQGEYYPRTTAAQRELLFKTWEETGDIDEACAAAKISRRTFYDWKARFAAEGYAGLAEYESRAPKEPHRSPQTVEQQVVELHRENPDWGKKRITNEVAQESDASAKISSNTIRRILTDAGLWPRRKE